MPSSNAASVGRRAEQAAARKYDLERDSTDSHDLRNPRNGYVYSVKACRTENKSGYAGRFRVWKASHEEFLRERGAYILAVYAPESGEIWKIEKVSQSAVDEAIGGEWYASGHQQKGKQYKIRWRELL